MIDFLLERPIVSIAQVMERPSVTRRAATQLVQQLTEKGILTEVTGQRRNRVFAALELIGVMEEG